MARRLPASDQVDEAAVPLMIGKCQAVARVAAQGPRPATRLMMALACPPAVLERPRQGLDGPVFPQGARAPLIQRSHGRT
jgi:hypothetical protein